MKMKILPEIQEALKQNKPIVALESTIITHGLPYPENIEMAKKVESIIRKNGAVPATIAIIDGQINVGLTKTALKRLATDKDVYKVSRRDFAYVLSQNKTGGTTVSGTIIIAAMAGISIFATGGIGGVHRFAETTMDISRDLEELANHPVAVVCAGPKAILDLPKTLEYLETKGVEVIGYKTKVLPAFYSDSSPYKVDYSLASSEAVAALLHTKWNHHLNSGVLIANPIPKAYSIAYERIEAVVESALKDMQAAGIKGKDSTPYLLNRIKEITEGKSLASNLALVYNNAEIAAKIAVAYANRL